MAVSLGGQWRDINTLFHFISYTKPPKQQITTQDFRNFNPEIFLTDLQNELSNLRLTYQIFVEDV